MIGKIKKLLLLPFTKVCYVESIFDKGLYDNNENSHAGSSLEDSNVLVVTNNEGIKDKVSSLLKEEKCYFHFMNMNSLSKKEDIMIACNQLGIYDHIINIIEMKSIDWLMTQDQHFNSDDILYSLYRLLQIETDYLVQYNKYATLTTAFKSEKSLEGEIVSSSVSHLINGLSKPLSNHGLVENGLTATTAVSDETIINTAIFLSSKYGQIMAGETLRLK